MQLFYCPEKIINSRKVSLPLRNIINGQYLVQGVPLGRLSKKTRYRIIPNNSESPLKTAFFLRKKSVTGMYNLQPQTLSHTPYQHQQHQQLTNYQDQQQPSKKKLKPLTLIGRNIITLSSCHIQIYNLPETQSARQNWFMVGILVGSNGCNNQYTFDILRDTMPDGVMVARRTLNYNSSR